MCNRYNQSEVAIREIEDKTCLRFVQKEDKHKDWLHFFSGSGCWSYVGRVGGEQMLRKRFRLYCQ